MTMDRQRSYQRRLLALSLTGVAIAIALVVGIQLFADDTAEPNPAPTVPELEEASSYDPVAAGERLPDGYRIGLARDAIAPVYEPRFTSAGSVDWPAETLVIGVAERQTAKAYPVTHLNQHEMVIDSLAGIPILVTW